MQAADEEIGYIEAERRRLQESTLSDIASNGLHASNDAQRLTSFDKKNNTNLFLYLIEPKLKINNQSQNPDNFFAAPSPISVELSDMASPNPSDVFSTLTHKRLEGIWSIILERSFMSNNNRLDKDSDREEWEDRLNSSVVFILKYPDEAPKELSSRHGLTKMSKNVFEYQSNKNFTTEQIIAILAPRYIANTCRKIFKNITIYDTDNCIESAVIPFPLQISESEFLNGPNYALAMKILDEKGILPTKFACHVTRLHSKQDLLKFTHYQNQLSLQSLLKKYKTTDANIAFRRIAAGWGNREDLMFLVSVATDLNVNGQSSNGNTAMHYAVERNNIEMIRYLLKLKVKRDIPNNKGETANSVAKNKLINFEDLLNGNYDKKIFKERALAKNPMFGNYPEMVGRSYKPRWLNP